MKQVLLIMLVLCCTSLTAGAQVPFYEHLQYQANARKSTVELPDFSVPLKKKYKVEKAIYKSPSKIFVVSDIEGQYEYFKQILQAGGVMDKNFNWTFDKGALVIVGDVFDRGSQVTECLWLIYYLEEKAKETGGQVHYILGNHEVMNLNGDLRYVNPKYIEFAKQTGVPYLSFYDTQTELGRWLRTKNMMEKIGDLLFVHGGVSQYINQLGHSIDSINILARNYYDRSAESMPQVEQLLLLDDGPLWYRGYFMAPLATKEQVDSTLRIFQVKKIILGHTPVERISTFYDGKIINVDVPHAKGASEGLLVDNKKYYKVNLQGAKELLEDGTKNVAGVENQQ
ncbi:metallophosphoesterase [Chitinophagaceae bacterium LB-8]|uniref:Metallophosphoesterase n=1 Tax=Paraflavisolibacter caeni TaxID=2982496 RepID=A0A9X2XZE9_9BACT|nr:metallophosphoesterase [Paraflavisolibacter caeni]MCU7551746.1 metallophosphoesterase [Paraflavisolibacter caeni]